MDIQRLREVLRAKMQAAGLKPRTLSREAGLNQTAVRDILDGRSKNPKIETLTKLATRLGLDLRQLAGALDAVPVLGTTPSASAQKADARGGQAAGLSHLMLLLEREGLDRKALASSAHLTLKRVNALVHGDTPTPDEIERLAAALNLGAVDVFRFAPLSTEEIEFVVELRRIGPEHRRHLRAMLGAMATVANDQKALGRNRSA